MSPPKLEPWSGLVSLFYPSLCPVCTDAVNPHEYLCATCRSKATRIAPPFCAKCSEPFAGSITGPFTCANCAHRIMHFDAAVSVYRSRGLVRKLVHEFKYGRQRQLRHVIGGWLVEAMEDPRLDGRRFDVVIPVPLHSARQRERGFNQAELLAEIFCATHHLQLACILDRIRYTMTQTAFDRTERMENLHDAFRLRKNADVRGLHVLLIDDVLTTGSTLSECARVLKAAGAVTVHAATAARA
ncbi:MAG TPA: ComF family protein [Chthoniobacterales bacterium]|nr:ComF family protein [Chthoniobacterales bacterium]